MFNPNRPESFVQGFGRRVVNAQDSVELSGLCDEAAKAYDDGSITYFQYVMAAFLIGAVETRHYLEKSSG